MELMDVLERNLGIKYAIQPIIAYFYGIGLIYSIIQMNRDLKKEDFKKFSREYKKK